MIVFAFIMGAIFGIAALCAAWSAGWVEFAERPRRRRRG